MWAWVDKGGPAVDSPYAGGPQTAEAYKAYFFSLIGKTEGSDASDWVAVLTASGIPTGLAAGVVPTTSMPYYALTQQIGAGGVRGRMFLPTSLARQPELLLAPVRRAGRRPRRPRHGGASPPSGV